ncbi:hypothetical protein KDH_79060 [Dictyobacter sp. S3.2.2.5]|uniref:Uncharacterized protein n=1 Tax=Dictyobacter halimunensis TaxID=3026934 RepID=A0ABQ6G4N6_9CHLR|nr:hypothetical protein KDH_79060 [Dictyobacter sp. S3.2.2.5]
MNHPTTMRENKSNTTARKSHPSVIQMDIMPAYPLAVWAHCIGENSFYEWDGCPTS